MVGFVGLFLTILGMVGVILIRDGHDPHSGMPPNIDYIVAWCILLSGGIILSLQVIAWEIKDAIKNEK